MPADCSVLHTPTILPNIRISWDYHPTFMLISGRFKRSKPTYERAHVGLDLLNLASLYSLISHSTSQNLVSVTYINSLDNITSIVMCYFAHHITIKSNTSHQAGLQLAYRFCENENRELFEYER